jgi:hypothetical protein
VSFRQKQFPTTISRDLAALVLGRKLGEGGFRRVYTCLLDDDLVVKVEEGSRSFANAFEWETWHRARGTPLARWLAPCWAISPCGSILLQYRTARLEREPKRVPSLFKDRKWNNWGRYKGRLVCHDYGLIEFCRDKVPPIVMDPW